MEHSLIFCPVNFQGGGDFVLEKSKRGGVLSEALKVLRVFDHEGRGCAEWVGS